MIVRANTVMIVHSLSKQTQANSASRSKHVSHNCYHPVLSRSYVYCSIRRASSTTLAFPDDFESFHEDACASRFSDGSLCLSTNVQRDSPGPRRSEHTMR